MYTIHEVKPSFRLSGLRGYAFLTLFLFTTLCAFSQNATTSESNEIQESDSIDPYILDVASGIQYDSDFVDKKLRKRGQKITVFGYYRLFLYGRNMREAYPGLAPQFDRVYSVGDGYREPMLSMTVMARPNGKTAFGSELFFFTPYDGTIENNTFTTNLGINFYGNFRTQHGNFGVRAGGIHWYNVSPFTMGVYQVLDRFTIFDRTPWEGANNTEKYDAYFSSGATSPGDLRWNNQAFQGLIINGARLPGDVYFDLFWGKTQPNGGLINAVGPEPPSVVPPFPPTLDAGNVPNYIGFAGDRRVLQSEMMGGKIGRAFGAEKDQVLAYNGLFSRTRLDSVRTDSARSYQVHTLSLDLKLGEIGVTGELGAGAYESNTLAQKWGEALMLRFRIPEDYTVLPLDIQVYQISKNFYNENGEIATNSNSDILEDAGLTFNATGAGGQIAQTNQLVHNRRGVTIGTGYDLGPVKLLGSWSLAQEIDAEAPVISYVHRINGLAMSRIYNPFPAGVTVPIRFGPYNRKLSFFRGISELVPTTDVDAETGRALNRKYFNTVDIQAKVNTTLFDKSLYFFYLGFLSSVSTKAEAAPVFNDESYVFAQYHEVDVYYEILPKFILTGYFGVEAARGGRNTAWNDNSDIEPEELREMAGPSSNLPLNQFGTAVGIGFDWMLAKNSGLYIRHRWMEFEDRSFSLDRYRGTETTIELKTFF